MTEATTELVERLRAKEREPCSCEVVWIGYPPARKVLDCDRCKEISDLRALLAQHGSQER